MGAGHAISVECCGRQGEQRVGGADSWRLGLETVVDDVFFAHGIVERVRVPETFEEVVVVGAVAFQQAATEEYSCTGEVAVREFAAVAVDYGVGEIGGNVGVAGLVVETFVGVVAEVGELNGGSSEG